MRFQRIKNTGKFLAFLLLVCVSHVGWSQSFSDMAGALNVDLGGNKDGGQCWADFNNDGFLDLAVNTNEGGFAEKSRLYYWNTTTSQFDDVTATHVSTQFSDRRERSALAGDFDNDGDLDFMRSTSTELEIYENSGAPNYFLTLTQEFTNGVAPFDGTTQNGMNNEGLAWMDFDGDGDLDVYMEDHQYGQDILENDGTGTFSHYTPDTNLRGFPINGSSGDYSVTADLDNDGYVDIVARREGTNTINPTDIRGYDIFFNQGNGNFSPVTDVNLHTSNSYKGGVAVADFDNDGDFDYLWTNHDDGTGGRTVVVEQTGLNSRSFQIATVTVTSGITGTLTALPTGTTIEGVAMGDMNNDGRVDVFLTDDSGTSYLLINNTSGGNFSFIHENSGIDVNGDGEGVAIGDYNNDGALDLYVNVRNGNNQLWENDLSGNTDYLKVVPQIDIGGGLTRPAIGATVVVDEEGCLPLKFIQEVSGGVGHGSQNDSRLHFGLPNGANLRYKVTVSFVRPNGGARTVVVKFVVPSALPGQTISILDTDSSDPDPAPSADNDSFVVTMNSTNNPLDVLDGDTDPNGEDLTISLPSGTTTNGGAITVNNNGTPADPTDDFISYTPMAGFFGSDDFTYDVTNQSSFCSSANVTITVNAPPTGDDNTISSPEDATYTFTVADFSVNYNDQEGDPLTEIRITELESVGSLLYNGSPVTLNQVITVADIAANLLTFVPVAQASGSPYDSFKFEVGDGTDFSTSDYDLTVNVTPVNDPPTGDNNAVATPEDVTYVFAVADFSLNYNDIEGNPLAEIQITSLESVGSLLYNGNPVTLNQVITVVDIAANLLTFVPVPQANGSPYDSFRFRVGDADLSSASYTLTVNVTPVNDTPQAVNDGTNNTNEDVSLSIDVLANDNLGDEPTAISAVDATTGQGGSAAINNNGTPADPSDDFIDYTPASGFSGTDTFSYTIRDNDGQTSSATVTIDVAPLNDTPQAVNDNASTIQNVGVAIDILGNDNLGDTPTTISAVDGTTTQGGIAVINNNGTPADPSDDFVDYTPATNFVGTDTFNYTIMDNDGETSNASVSVTVTAGNSSPQAIADPANTMEDNSVSIDVLANDDLGDTPTNISAVDATTAQGGSATVNDNGTPADPSDDFIDYTPAAGFNGTDFFSYTIRDNDGQTSSATVTVDVSSVNDTPQAINDNANTTQNVGVIIDVMNNDNLGDAPTGISAVDGTTAQNGTAVVNNNATPADPSDDFVDYTPATGFSGTDTFTYTIMDDDGETSIATVTIMITINNSSPQAVADPINTVQDTPVSIDVLGNDNLGNTPTNITLVDAVTTQGGAAVINDNGTPADPSDDFIDYTPSAGFSGIDTFTYTIEDDDGETSTATVTVNVSTAGNNSPVANSDSYNTNVNTSLSIAANGVLGNDSDADGDPLTVTTFDAISTNGGTVSVNADGSFDYTPPAAYSGADSFTYTTSDGNGGTATASVNLNVNSGSNNAPTVNDINISSIVNQDINFTVANFDAAFSDTDGDGLNKIQILSLPNNGTLLLNGVPVVINQEISRVDLANLSIVPEGSFTGDISFDWTAHDGKEYAATSASVNINIPYDSDGDGIPDEEEIGDDPDNPDDTDNDGDPDYDDPDSDDDGIPDGTEAGDDPENPEDSDGDGDPDYQDEDSDNDGIPDVIEAGDDPDNPEDTDGDGDPDYLDDDSDGDGKSDQIEGFEDCDSDGLANFIDPDDDCSGEDGLTFYKGISPNGDGYNDKWDIDGITTYPDNQVRVYNRWGNLVYEAKGYDNTSQVWWGQSNQGIIFGQKELPDGTYFYIVELGNGSETRSGYVMLKR